MTRLVSIHAVVISDPAADLVFSGHYTKDGEPILRKSSITVEPSSFFEVDDAEAERLVERGAARLPTEQEITLGKPSPEAYAAYLEVRS